MPLKPFSLLIPIFVLSLLTSCGENREYISVYAGKSGGIDSVYKKEYNNLIDYYNSRVIDFALRNRPDVSSTLSDQRKTVIIGGDFKSVWNAIPDNEADIQKLCQEIEQFKRNDTLIRDNPDVGRFFTSTVFSEQTKNTALVNFYHDFAGNDARTKRDEFLKELNNELISIAQNNRLIKTDGGFILIKNVLGILLAAIVVLGVVKISVRKIKGVGKSNMKKSQEAPADNKGLVKKDKMENKPDNTKAPENTESQKDEVQHTHLQIAQLKKTIEAQREEIAQLKKENTLLKQQSQRNETVISAPEIKVMEISRKEEPKDTVGDVYYFPPPNSQGFPVVAGSTEKRTYDAFQLQVKKDKAFFKLMTDDLSVIQRAIESSENYILPVCEIDPKSTPFGKATKIQVLKEGILLKEGEFWRLSEKSMIKLI